MEASAPQAFVLMPFDEDSEAVYERLVKPPLEGAGYVVNRADSVVDQQNVLRDIVTGIDRASLIVVDMTGLNPNVFYELGIAHGLGVPTVLIAQSIEEVPFDLRSYRVQEYSVRFDEAADLTAHLKDVAEHRAQGRVEFGSPVSDFLPESSAKGRLEAAGNTPLRSSASGPRARAGGAARGQASPGETATRVDALRASGEGLMNAPVEEEDEEDDEEGEPGLLDLLDTILSENTKSSVLMERITEANERITAELQDHTTRIYEEVASQEPDQLTRVRRIAADIARDIEKYADELDELVPALEISNARLTESGIKWIHRIPISEPDPENIHEFMNVMTNLAEAANATGIQTAEYRASLGDAKGLSKTLDVAIDRTAALVDRLIVVIENTRSYANRAQQIAEERLYSMHFVAEPKVPLFADAEGKTPRDFEGVLLASPTSNGVEERVYPHRGDPLPKGSPVTWEWSLDQVFPESWYRHPETGELIYGWTESAGFDGKPYDPGSAVEETGTEAS